MITILLILGCHTEPLQFYDSLLWKVSRDFDDNLMVNMVEGLQENLDMNQGSSRLEVFSVLLMLPIRKTNIRKFYNEAVFILFIGWREKYKLVPVFDNVFCNE